jgi:hypothetical protein
MTVARSVADVLDEHVTLEVECIDRMFLNVYQPRLQHVNGVVAFFRGHRGATFASSALMDPISKDFVGALHRFCRDQPLPMLDFARGQRKDDLAHEHLAAFQAQARAEGVLFIGPGAGDGSGVPHREAPQPDHRRVVYVDRELDRDRTGLGRWA